MFRIQKPIRKRLTWINMLVSGAALLVALAVFVAYEVSVFRLTMIRNLSIQAQIVGSNSASALLFNDSKAARNTLSALKAATNILSAGVYGADGEPLAMYWRGAPGAPPRLPAIPPG